MKYRGFTLVELLVVATLIALLVGTGVFSYRVSVLKALDTRRKEDLLKISSALEFYKYEKGNYPTANNCSTLASALQNYLPKFPTDPKEPDYIYYCNSNQNDFTLGAYLEIEGGSSSTYNCGASKCNYLLGPNGEK